MVISKARFSFFLGGGSGGGGEGNSILYVLQGMQVLGMLGSEARRAKWK